MAPKIYLLSVHVAGGSVVEAADSRWTQGFTTLERAQEVKAAIEVEIDKDDYLSQECWVLLNEIEVVDGSEPISNPLGAGYGSIDSNSDLAKKIFRGR